MGVIFTRNNQDGLIDLIKYEAFDGCETVDVSNVDDWKIGLLSAKYVIVAGAIVLNDIQDE